MPEPLRDSKMEELAMEILMDGNDLLSRSGPQIVDELSRIAKLYHGRELKAGQPEPSGKTVLELTFGPEGKKRVFAFSDQEKAEQAFMAIANQSDPSTSYTASEIRPVP